MITNESDIDDVFESILQLHQTYNIIIDSVLDHTISISKYIPLAGSSYIKLPKQLDLPIKCLINFPKIDYNEYFKRSLVRYLHPTDHDPRRNRKVDKLYGDKLNFKY